MRRALRDFADQARDSDIAVVYYAGHGIEIDGTNYLIPTDARLERDTDIYDEAFSLDRVLLAIEPARQLRLVIVDACRNNPFADTMKRTVSSRTVSRGLARIEPTTTNTLVAFAAKAGLTALDGNSKNSPYAAALVKHIATPGLDLRRAFGFVRDDVLQATGNRQEPYLYGSLGGADVALVPAKPVALDAGGQRPVGYTAGLRAGVAARQQGRLDRLPCPVSGWILREPRQASACQDRRQKKHALRRPRRPGWPNRSGRGSPPRGHNGRTRRRQPRTRRLAEEIRVTAEKTKQAVQEQVAEAERQQAAADTPAAGTPPESKMAAVDASANEPAAAPPAIERTQGPRLASLDAGPPQAELIKSVQTELRRVGCLTAAADGEWNAASRRSLALFNRNAGTKFDVKLASLDALDAIKLKPSRVCPLICEHGFKADGDQCSKIVCAEGSVLNDDNECVKRRGKTAKTPVAKRERGDAPARAAQDRPKPAQRQTSGQIVCDDHLCRPVDRGCHLEFRTTRARRRPPGRRQQRRDLQLTPRCGMGAGVRRL